MLWLRRWFGLRGVALAVTLVGLLVVVGSAQAAFSGRNGLLAVEPLKGSGIVLVTASGRGERRVCADSPDGARVCALYRPEWSPDGRTLVSSLPWGGFVTISSDGRCVQCLPSGEIAAPADAVFTGNSTVVIGLQSLFVWPRVFRPGALVEYGVDRLQKKVLLTGPVSSAVWSPQNELAVVRKGWIWVGIPGRLHRLERGSAPSWSPDGSEIVFVRHGWLMVRRLRGGQARLLVLGVAPAWSPNGRWIAFIGPGHRLRVVRSIGGRVRLVGRVTGTAVDWQPLPSKPPVSCLMPPGTRVTASGSTSILGVDATPAQFGYTWAVLGCRRVDGRSLVLDSGAPAGDEFASFPSSEVVAGNYAGLVVSGGGKYISCFASTKVFDLRSGARVWGGESPRPSGQVSWCGLNQLVLGADAVSAVHATAVETAGPPYGCDCTVEQVIASDRLGVRTLDSVNEPIGSPSNLTNLALAGDTLTWEHNGSPRGAQLSP